APVFADLLEDFVVADVVTGFFDGGARGHRACAWTLGTRRWGGLGSGRRLFEKFTRFLVGLKQGLDESAKPSVPPACPVEIGRAFQRGQRKGSLEDGFFGMDWIVHGRN